MKDRSQFMGQGSVSFGPASPQTRAEVTMNLRGVFSLLEDTLLADGRDWIAAKIGGAEPSLADLEAVWLLHWLRSIPGALPKDVLSKRQFPRVFAWIQRFDEAVQKAASSAAVATISGADATKTIVSAECLDRAQDFGAIAPEEPVAQALGLKKGDRVVVYPVDTGSTHKDSGRLLSLDAQEIVFETKAAVEGQPAVRVHAPRLGFRVVREDQISHL